MNLQSHTKSSVYRAAVYLAMIGTFWSGLIGPAGADEARAVTVPLIQRGVHVFVAVTIEDRPMLFGLDTGAGANVLTPQAAGRLGLNPEKGQVNVLGAGGVSTAPPAVKIGTLRVGEAATTAQTAYIIPLPDALACDGLLGTPFFREWIVQIDYAHLRLSLMPRAAFRPPAGASAVPIRFYNNIPALEATVDGIKGLFKIDTGAGDAVTVFSPFVAQHHLRGKYVPSLHTITGRGVGGVVYGDLVRLPTFGIGSFHFTNVAATLSLQTEGAFAGKESAGNLGGEIWQRFTLTLDYPENKIFLARNAHFEEPFIANRSGLALDTEQGALLVRSVLPNGPGIDAGVQAGDTVLAIDETPVEKMKFWEVRAVFRGEPGSKIRLRLRRTDKT